MAEIWPSTLGTKWPAEGYRPIIPENTLRTKTISGRLVSRKRFTNPREAFDVMWVWDRTQLNTFYTFYITTVDYGSKLFQGLVHPRTNVNSVWGFLAEPELQSFQGSGFFTTVSMKLQHQPDAPA